MTTRVNIFSCKNTTIKIEGKLSAVMMQSCKKCVIQVDNVMSMVEVVKSEAIKVEASKSLKTLSMENNVQVQVYLTHATKNVQMQVMSCMSVTVYYPREGAPENSEEEGDVLNFVIPEVFTTTIAGDKRKTEEVEGIE